MRAEIKDLYSPDIKDLDTYLPSEEDVFGFLLQVMVGPKGFEGEESFDMMVCTPKWLMKQHKHDSIIFGRHLLIVFEYNYDRIKQTLTKYIDSLYGESWEDIANIIAKIGFWEFEDYQE